MLWYINYFPIKTNKQIPDTHNVYTEVEENIYCICNYIFQTWPLLDWDITGKNFRKIATSLAHGMPNALWDPKDAPGTCAFCVKKNANYFLCHVSAFGDEFLCKRDHKSPTQ